MKFATLSFFAALAIPVSLFGHLGETEPEMTARYGTPVSKGTEATFAQGKVIGFGSKVAFIQGDWTIDCSIVDDRCAKVVYSKKGDWVEDQFTAVLSANAQGDNWRDKSKEMTRALLREWRRGDGATAKWQMGVGMVVTNPAFERAKQRAEDKAKADAAQVPKL